MPSSPLSPPLPLPPPVTQTVWGGDEIEYLEHLLHELAAPIANSEKAIAAMVDHLLPRLSSSRGVERYYTARDYHLRETQEELSYRDWLKRVIGGFERYHPAIAQATEPGADGRPSLYSLIGRFVDRNCIKVFNRQLDAERRSDLIGDVLLSLTQNFFYDTELEPWLWTTTHNHVLLELRRERRESESVSLDETPSDIDLFDKANLIDISGVHQNVLDAIRSVENRRYRVILLLVYLYDLDNTQLAAFFGVSVARLTTWLARARSAARRQYEKSDQPHTSYSSHP